MKIYFGHSKELDYLNYYRSITDNIKEYTFLFPHVQSSESRNGRLFYKPENFDVFIAEVTYPATGLGIELGFAYDEKIPIYCFYKKGSKPSNSLKSVTNNIIEYTDMSDFLTKLEELLHNLDKLPD